MSNIARQYGLKPVTILDGEEAARRMKKAKAAAKKAVKAKPSPKRKGKK